MPMNARLLRPAASGFNPATLPGFTYWLDASQASTVTTATGVSQWRSAGSSAIAGNQATANNQPAYQLAAQNGRNAVYFDGTNDSITFGNLSASFPSAATAIFAFRPDADTEYSLYTTASNSGFWAFPTSATYISTFKGTRLNNVSSPQMPTGTQATVIAVTSSASAYRVYINGTLAHDLAADYLAGTNHILGTNDLGAFFRGWLYEAIFTSSELPVATIAAARTYLRSKWGI